MDANNTISNIEYVSGQLGFFFGSEQELSSYIKHTQSNKKIGLRVQVRATDYLAELTVSKNTPITRFNLNVTALKTLSALQDARADATVTEQAILAKYQGWGGCSNVFNPHDQKWSKRFNQLKNILTAKQWQSAKSSTLSSFYTPDYISKAIYAGLVEAGVNSGSFLDTSAGVGGLIRTMPEQLYKALNVNLVEQDSISAEILEKLYPSARIQNTGFQDAKFSQPMSLIVHNPPFGQATIFDKNNNEFNGLSLHNYFMSKGVSLLGPKGWMIAIVSRSFLDAKCSKARELVGKYASLVGAIRLPKQVFECSTGANATVDLLVLEAGAEQNQSWYQSNIHADLNGNDYQLNDYFINHPENLIGTMMVQGNYKGNSVHCIGEENYELASTLAIKNLFKGLKYNAQTSFEPTEAQQSKSVQMIELCGVREFSYAVGNDNQIYQLLNDNWSLSEISGVNKGRLAAMCGIRHSLMSLLDAEQADLDITVLDNLRAELNSRYDAFIKSYGFIHDAINQRVSKLDPTNYNLLSLETSYNSGITPSAAKKLGIKSVLPTANKAEIFTQRVLSPWTKPTTAKTPEDALIASTTVYGRVDIAYCASLLNLSESDFIGQTNGSLIFNDNGNWVSRNVYLSGDVKTKLADLTKIPFDADLLNQYTNALSSVVPIDVPFESIKISLGASWIPANIYQEFVNLLCESKQNTYTKISFLYAANSWLCELSNLPYQLETRLGSNDAWRFSKLLPALMNGKSTTVTYKDQDGRRAIDKQATLENEINSEKIQGAWDAFLTERIDVQNTLSALYNDIFNRYAPLTAAGNTITLPGSNAAIQLRENQLNAVYRAITEGKLLIAHEVGAGKTYTIAAIIHELLRLGLKQRAVCVVPNHLTGQFAAGYLQLYPQDQVTVLNPDELSPSTRTATLLRLKTGAKIIVVPESSFAAIPVDADVEQMVIEKEIDSLESALWSIEKQDGARFSVKAIENKKASLKTRLEELASDDRKTGLSITELGIDLLILDEAHYIKNLAYSSGRLTNVRGCGTPTGSKRAFDWYLKIQCLKNQLVNGAGLGVYFATGTPISNTLLETYTFLKYLNEEQLNAQGITSIDDFVSIYATVSTEFEVSPTGQGFKSVTRLRSFQNLPQLKSLWVSIADCVNSDELLAYLPPILHNGKEYPAIPPITGGKIRQVVVEATTTQKQYTDFLVQRAKCFSSSPIENDNMLAVMGAARKASIDMRLVDPTIERIESGEKVNACIQITADKYHATSAVRGTQILFLDVGVPNKDGKHSVYNDIKTGLILQGLKSSEIAFAQDFKTPLKKAELYSKMNAGIIRVVIASTLTLGCGANVNERLVGIVVLDAPYRPADLTQRLGRGIRQGNQLYQNNPDKFTLDITFIATRHSLDSYLFQTLENKQAFISQFNSASGLVQSCAMDLSNTDLTYAELKAETSGSPLVLQMVTLTKTIQRLEAERHAFIRDQRNANNNKQSLLTTLQQNTMLLNGLEQDVLSGCHIPQTQGAFVYLASDGKTYTSFKDASNNITSHLQPIAESINNFFLRDTVTNIGQFAGFNLSVETIGRHMQLLVKGSAIYKFNLDVSKPASTGKQVLMTINNLLTNSDKFISRFQSTIDRTNASIEVAELAINAKFDALDQLIECKQSMIELKAQIAELESNNETNADDVIETIEIAA